MAHTINRSQVNARPFGASRPRQVAVRSPVASRRVSRSQVEVKAFFNFFTPKPKPEAVNPKAKELSEALVDIVSQTKPGAAVSPVVKAEIEELVSELQPLCIKNPLRSPLLWGTYKVLYASKPSAVGGPLTKGAGPVLAPGQEAKQILQEPNTLINEVTFKTLGFLPGYSKQFGQIKALSGDTFLLSIKEGEISTGFGKQSKQFDIERQIQIVYLDDNLRIARFLPNADLADEESQAAEGGPEDDEILFVFQRVAEQQQEEEEEVYVEEEEEEEQARAPSPVLNLFGGTRKVESLATQAERRVKEQRTRRGTQPFFVGGRGRDEEEEEEERDDPRAARARQQAEAANRRQREQEERRAAQDRAKQEAASAKAAEQARAAKEKERLAREKEAERARIQREKEAEARARAAQEARERAEAEKAAKAERAAKIRELLAELGEELKEKQAAAREAAKDVREVMRDNQGVLKQVAAAESGIAEAEREVQQVSAALDEAVAARKSVEQQVKAAQQAVREAEAAYKQKVATR